ncbi:MAG TPA: RsmE family RNA methyltransferase [Sedimentisphaerales bacterium]|nr:RsmE family RNA methyltransferase [Sedimentisphaerales bacterium]
MKKTGSHKRYASHVPADSLHRFFVSSEALEGENAILRGRQAHQISEVLRLGPGEHIIALDNFGWEHKLRLTKVGKYEIRAEVVGKELATSEPAVRITLFQSLGKQDKFEWVLQKCTEIGVVRFVPVIAERSVVRNCREIGANKLSRWKRIITEAAEQSHRGVAPVLDEPIKLEKGMAELEGFERSLIASTRAQGMGLRDSLRGCGACLTGGVGLALIVGPEGGFTEDEVERGRAGGAIPFTLGPRILRTETAAVVAASVILYELGELDGRNDSHPGG